MNVDWCELSPCLPSAIALIPIDQILQQSLHTCQNRRWKVSGFKVSEGIQFIHSWSGCWVFFHSTDINFYCIHFHCNCGLIRSWLLVCPKSFRGLVYILGNLFVLWCKSLLNVTCCGFYILIHYKQRPRISESVQDENTTHGKHLSK